MKLLVLAFLLIALSAFCRANEAITEVEGIEFLPNFLPKFASPKYCATEDIYAWKKAVKAAKTLKAPTPCVPEGQCDYYNIRNSWEGNLNINMEISLFVTVICTSTGVCPGGMNPQRITDQIQQINTDFAGTGVVFVVNGTQFPVDPTYANIPPYSGSNSNWYIALLNLKNKYAVNPAGFLNVFVTGQQSGSAGTLLGIGTFPWDQDAPTNYGGLWVNANYFGAGQKTASHEIGHNVGLWHTFHGDSEVRCGSVCYERVHSDNGDETDSNNIGDFCADTPAQPMNYNCALPTGADCFGTRYQAIPTDQYPGLINNFMAYTPDNCYTQFTRQQAMRAHCWICDRLPNWVPDPKDCVNSK